MSLAYQQEYNERVMQNNEPFNMKALGYLDEHFEKHVTQSLEECLKRRPSNPIKFIASRIMLYEQECQRKDIAPLVMASDASLPSEGSGKGTGQSNSDLSRNEFSAPPSSMETSRLKRPSNSTASVAMDGESPNFNLHFAGGLHCEVKALASPPKPAEVLDGFPIIKLTSPSEYEIEAALRHLEPSSADGSQGTTPTLIIFEPPTSPAEVIFVKGIPYMASLVGDLQYHGRRGTPGVDLPQAGKDFSSQAMRLLRESLGDDVKTLSDLKDAIVAEVASPSKSEVTAEGSATIGGSRPHAVILPNAQESYLDTFDCIDKGFRAIMNPNFMKCIRTGNVYGQLESLAECVYTQPPAVLFVTYNEEKSPLTFARVLSSFFPYYEDSERNRIQSVCDVQQKHVRDYNLSFCLKYWTEVHRRREDRDEARGVRRGGAARRRPKKVMADDAAAKSSLVSAPIPSAPHSMTGSHNTSVTGDDTIEERKRLAAAARSERRQVEDSAFLHVMRVHQEQSVVKVQAIYRGYRDRQRLRRQGVVLGRRTPHGGDTAEQQQRYEEPYPDCVPPLLRKCALRLSSQHGELFGNYPDSLLPEPRCVRIFVPSRHKLPAGDDGICSESDEWAETSVFIPPAREAQPNPHFNPLRRLLQYHSLAGCDVMENALKIQAQCGGMSHLQRRAYDMIKSVSLDLLHIAFSELFHRRQLPMDALWFSSFVHAFHGEVLGWLAQPHFISLSERLGEADDNPSGILCSEEVLNYERVLIQGCQEPIPSERSGSLPAALYQRAAPHVFVVSPVLTESRIEEVIHRIKTEVKESEEEAKPEGDEEDEETATVAAEAAEGEDVAAEDDKEKRASTSIVTQGSQPHSLTDGGVMDFSHQAVIGSVSASNVILPHGFSDEKAAADAMAGEADVDISEANCQCLRLSWWSMCPSPVTYVDGSTFVLAPRWKEQRVEGRKDIDQFVLRQSKLLHTYSQDVVKEDGQQLSSVNSCTEKDGLFSPAELCAASDTTVGVHPVVASPLLSSLFGSDLMQEDEYLCNIIQQRLTADGELVYYRDAALTTEGDMLRRILGQETYSQTLRCKKMTRCWFKPTPPVLTASESATAAGCSSSKHSSAPSVQSNKENKTSQPDLSLGKLPAAPSPKKNAGNDLSSAALPASSEKNTPKGSSPASPATPAVESNTEAPQEDKVVVEAVAKTPFDAIRDVVGRVGRVSVQCYRPWLLVFPGEEWLGRYEKFIDGCLTQIKEGNLLVLSADIAGYQTLYVATAVLLSIVVKEVEVEANNKQSTSGASKQARRVLGKLNYTDESQATGVEPQLYFLEEFYTLLRSTLTKKGVCVDDCVARVTDVLNGLYQANNQAFSPNSICSLLKQAEQEPDLQKCRELILRAIRCTEQFCWLLLFDIFISIPFSKESLQMHVAGSLSSFALFMKGVNGATDWIETINPWKKIPHRCPDSSHLRYSNGLRRWDNEDYICFGSA